MKRFSESEKEKEKQLKLEAQEKKKETEKEFVKNLLSINGVKGIFLSNDFISINKEEKIDWEDIKHIVISLINEFYSDGKEFIIDKKLDSEKQVDYDEIEKQIIKILDTKIKPAVARDGGDIKFKSFDNGLVTVELQGSCSGCPSSMATLKQGVQNLLCHYVSEVKRVEAV